MGDRARRPWGGRDPPAVVYTYAPGSCSPTIVASCSATAMRRIRITVAFCWSHLRREFFKIAERGDAKA
jgi:transposase